MTSLLDWVDSEMDKIEADERFYYKSALVQINAPLALEQVGMHTRHRTLNQVRLMITSTLRKPVKKPRS